MRQGQHKNRSRGRNQRRPGNSTNRVFESNGPDVKVRGTAQTVAEKYLQLARDAVSSGDTVMSDSYYQHAEHYMRIIAANQGQREQQQRMQEAEAGETSAHAAPGTGPQPGEPPAADGASQQAADVEAKSNGETISSAQAQEGGDAVDFDDDLPQFLKNPADETSDTEKPKRARRTPSKSKSTESSKDDTADKSSDADDEVTTESASDAEAAVG